MANAIHGASELQATFVELRNNGVGRVARSMAGAGITVVRRYQVKAAPRGKTGAIRAAIGRKVSVSRKANFITAKAGINVGKKSKAAQAFNGKLTAPHAHFVAGTKPRYRKRIGGKFAWVKHPSPTQLSTGRGPVNNFIEQAYNAAKPAAAAAMEKAGRKALEREAARVKRK